jgi:pimeloyl-ACP methyl ester carboxylesterase
VAPRAAQFFTEAGDGTRLFVEQYTQVPGAPVALLCDGLVCDGFIYKYLTQHLQELLGVAHFHYRGHGRSQAPVDRNQIDVRALAADVNSVRHALGDPEIVLVGHSLGTQVVLEACHAKPEKVRALVLMCGSFGRVTHTFKGSDLLANVLPDLIEWVTRHPRIARALWTRIPVKAAMRAASLMGDVNAARLSIEDVAPYFQHVVHVDFELFLRMLRLAGEHSAEHILPQIEIPALVIAGERDTITPPALSRILAETLQNGRLQVIPDATHLAPLEAHAETVEFIREFLDEAGILP